MSVDRGESGLDLHVVRNPSSATITAVGELDIASVAKFRSVVFSLLATDDRRVIVVLDRVTFIDSSGLAALVAAHRHAGEVGGTFAISSPSQPVERVLRLTSLDRVLSCVDRPDPDT